MINLQPALVEQDILSSAMLLILGRGDVVITEELAETIRDIYDDNFDAWYVLWQKEEQAEVYQHPAIYFQAFTAYIAEKLYARISLKEYVSKMAGAGVVH